LGVDDGRSSSPQRRFNAMSTLRSPAVDEDLIRRLPLPLVRALGDPPMPTMQIGVLAGLFQFAC
jgi:hypothetical protein